MEKNDIYYYEKDGEMYAMKKVSEMDIEYTIKESHYTFDMWRDLRLSLVKKLKYFSLQEDGDLYFEMKYPISDSIRNRLPIVEEMNYKIIYDVPDVLFEKCANIFDEENDKVLCVYTDKYRFLDSFHDYPYYGKSSVFQIASYLADRQYRMMINDHMLLDVAEVYAICDYPLFGSSISCQIRDVSKMGIAGYTRIRPSKEKGQLLQQYSDMINNKVKYYENEYIDYAIDISNHIKDSMNEIESVIRNTKKMIDEGTKINLCLCVKNRKQKLIVNDLINYIINPIKVLN